MAIKKRLGSLLGPEGRTPQFIEGSTTQIEPHDSAKVTLTRTGDAEYTVDVQIPRGLDGDPTAVANFSEAMATEIRTEGTAGLDALDSRIEQRAVTGVGVTRIVASTDPLYPLDPGELLVLLREDRPQFFTDFSSYEAGATPHDWVYPWVQANWAVENESSALGGKVLEGGGSSGRTAILWNIPGGNNQPDMEIVYRWRAIALISGVVRGVLQGAGTAGTEEGYWGGWNADVSTVGRYAGGVSTSIGDGPLTNIEPGQWYISRMRVQGGSVMLRTWPAGGQEPYSWDVHTTGPNSDQPIGRPGVMALSTGEFQIDWFGVGLEGARAPKEPLS